MKRSAASIFLLLAFVLNALTPDATARDRVLNNTEAQFATTLQPAYCIAAHRVNKLSISVNNNGTLGSGWPAGGSSIDCFTGDPVPSCEYPIDSDVEYLFGGALWVGAVVGTDTLVSTGTDGWSCMGAEFRPDESPLGEMIYRSIRSEDPGSVSEEDYVATYWDTFPYVDPNAYLGELHQPLNLMVMQTSYAWSYPHAEDFVIILYQLFNTGEVTIDPVYAGLYVDADVGHSSTFFYHTDDITGFLESDVLEVPGTSCQYIDTVNMAWIADNDGDPSSGDFRSQSCTGVTGTSVLRLPEYQSRISYNWWISSGDASRDFGPRERPGVGVWPEDWRDFGTGGLGTPEGDHNKYYQLSNMEIDYDQIFTASITPSDPVWIYPDPTESPNIADGHDTKYLLSFGPFELVPHTWPKQFWVAYVGGENLHIDPANAANLPFFPNMYYDNLDFSDFASNARWASWVFDNPGVDSDQDGYYGKAINCGDSLIYIEGDYIPDVRAATPPETPIIRCEWEGDGIRLKWNGLPSETRPDVVSRVVDFEGYRVYISTHGTAGTFALMYAYDVADYLKYVFDYATMDWQVFDAPFTLEELRCLYASSCDDLSFYPLDFTSGSPYVSGDSIFYFEAFGDNFALSGSKAFPSQPYPSSLNPGEADPAELTEEGYFKYFEYELDLSGLNPGVCYYVSVTAYDYGWPASDAIGLESDCEDAAVYVCATDAPDGPSQELMGYRLCQNVPNPFNPSTEISFSLAEASQVRLEVYNIAGQRLATVATGFYSAGEHSVTFDGSGLASGIYMYRLEAGAFVETKKMVLLK